MACTTRRDPKNTPADQVGVGAAVGAVAAGATPVVVGVPPVVVVAVLGGVAGEAVGILVGTIRVGRVVAGALDLPGVPVLGVLFAGVPLGAVVTAPGGAGRTQR